MTKVIDTRYGYQTNDSVHSPSKGQGQGQTTNILPLKAKSEGWGYSSLDNVEP